MEDQAPFTLENRDNDSQATATLLTLVEDPAGLADLGRGEGYVARQVGGWSARYRKARTRNVGSFETVMGWLEANQLKAEIDRHRRHVGHRRRPSEPVCCRTTAAAARARTAANTPVSSGAGSPRSGRVSAAGE